MAATDADQLYHKRNAVSFQIYQPSVNKMDSARYNLRSLPLSLANLKPGHEKKILSYLVRFCLTIKAHVCTVTLTFFKKKNGSKPVSKQNLTEIFVQQLV